MMGKENDRFNSEQAILPEFLERATVMDMATGSVAYIDCDDLLIDGNRKCFVHGDAQFHSSELEWDDEITLVKIDEGYVVDLSGDYEKSPRFTIATEYELVHESGDNLLPVVGFVISEKDLLDFDKQYKEQTGHHYIDKEIRKTLKKRVKATRAIIREAQNSRQ